MPRKSAPYLGPNPYGRPIEAAPLPPAPPGLRFAGPLATVRAYRGDRAECVACEGAMSGGYPVDEPGDLLEITLRSGANTGYVTRYCPAHYGALVSELQEAGGNARAARRLGLVDTL